MDKLNFASCDVEEIVESARIIVETELGRKVSDADPIILLIKSFVAIIAQQRQIIDEAANQNLLYYSTEKNLDALGELVGVKRLTASKSFCTVEITLSAPRTKETVIKAGTRVSTADNVHFALNDDVIFLAGETLKTAHAECTEFGEIGNGYLAGEISRIVDPQPFLLSIKNITASEGGADIESDDDLRERIRIAPESFSVAGSRGSYIYWAKQSHNLVQDVNVVSPVPGYVDVYILLEGGQVPGEEFLNHVQNYLSDEKIRPLTDFVTVKPAEVVFYDIDCKYFISTENQTSALAIKTAAEKALQDFINWQRAKLGRDIEPTTLIYKLREAGASRVIVEEPAFQIVPQNAVAIPNNVNLVYCGLKEP